MKKVSVDGNTAAAHIAYNFSEVASIYPITPSSTMAELCDEWQAQGKLNLFNQPLKVIEMQSEAGAVGTLHGSLVGGALSTTFTASQGLLLMIPNMYKIAGELLPTVFHVSARALSTHALSIFGDQADVMACRNTGFAMIASGSVQECNDLATVAHIATLNSSIPFVHFFDGFRTSHEINNIQQFEKEDLLKVLPVDAIQHFRNRALNSTTPHQQGTAQNPDIYFQNREACNKYYSNAIMAVEDAMQMVYKISGRRYHLFDYYGDKDADKVIVIMGSGYITAKVTAEYLNKNLGYKCGVIAVRLYRPFSAKHLLKVLPKTVKSIAVLDRTKEPGSDGEPLYKDICTAITNKDIKIVGGRYGLGGKEFTPAMVKSVFDNLNKTTPKNNFTVGINDDVTNLSLTVKPFYITSNAYACKFFGLGSDGTVSANKNSIKIIGDNTKYNCQGYFEYDSKKSGSLTTSHLRFGKVKEFMPYLVNKADFIACHNINFVGKYNVVSGLKENGIFLLNCNKKDLKNLPQQFINDLIKSKANLYVIDANQVSQDSGLGQRINVVMQACFFKLVKIINYSKAEQLLIEAAKKTYGRKGDAIVEANIKAIQNATKFLKKIKLTSLSYHNIAKEKDYPDYYKNFILPIENKTGDNLPVSSFSPDGYVPTNTSQYEKRGISINSPEWIPEKCIQCGMCSMACPHACIRPILIKKDAKRPKTFVTRSAIGVKDYDYRIQINVRDCTGCSNCTKICPVKALNMVPSNELEKKEDKNYEYSKNIENPSTIFPKSSLKGSQFLKPYFEFSGACAGCGETPYIKLVSQLFGNRMVVANATGCSSIYSGSAPTCPFSQNKLGNGTAWASSLFEDNAEFGLGIELSKKANRDKLKSNVNDLIKTLRPSEFKSLLQEWLDNFDNGDKTYELSIQINNVINKNPNKYPTLIPYKNYFTKESVWIIGGDGWAYDIGYGGLDHVLASGENVNILVLDTEVYSNTGGQSSKATPMGAVAKFSTLGKKNNKKNLALMAMAYKNVYVAQIGLGADMNQAAKAFVEAESYNGPSIIIAYAPCINHGIAMDDTQNEIKRAVECGYWHLFRYDPRNIGNYPFKLDSPEPHKDYIEFLKGENRYKSLQKTNKDVADKLMKQAQQEAKEKYEQYKDLANKK